VQYGPGRHGAVSKTSAGGAGLRPAGAVAARDAMRGRGAAVLASLMSSRSWVRIPPALPLADAEHGRAHCAVTAASPTVVVRLHPSASNDDRRGDEVLQEEHLACTEEERVRLPPSPPFASVVSTASTRPLYGRGVGSTPAGGFSAPEAQWTEHCLATAAAAGSNPAGRAYAAETCATTKPEAGLAGREASRRELPARH
jgi:hypothetical protein